MKISVITVCYNSKPTIERALRSVAGQTHLDLEHILIDGASCDGTLEVINPFLSRRCSLFSEADNGIYDAMNKGLERATGEVICFLNADDSYASPQVLECVSNAMKYYDCDLLLGDVTFFRADQPDKTVRRYRSDRFRPSRLSWGWMPAHPAMFMKNSVYKEVGPFKTTYDIAGDYEFLVRAFSKRSISFRHIPSVMVRMQLGGVSTRSLSATWKLNTEVIRACRENGLKTNLLKVFSKYPLKMLEYFRT